jgi:hypothetical protein
VIHLFWRFSNRFSGGEQVSGPVDVECLTGEGLVLTASQWHRYGAEVIKVNMLRKIFLPFRL